jgi:uncharacterized protein (TIGR03437 family)
MLAPLSGQFSSLIAPGNGADVYLCTSLSLKGSGQPQQGRIYKIGSTPLELVAAVANSGFPEPCIGTCLTNAYDLRQPDLSRDGTVLAYTGRSDCTGSATACSFHVNPYQTTVQGVPGKGTLDFHGLGRLSSNGRHLVLHIPLNLYAMSEFDTVDLQTGERSAQSTISGTGARFTPNGRVVADDGTFVVVMANALVHVFRGGQRISAPRLSDAQLAANAVIDASGRTVVYQYQASYSSPSQLRVFHPDTNDDRVFLQGDGYLQDPVITADGQKVAFISSARLGTTDPPGSKQLYLVGLDGTGLRALTRGPDDVQQFTLSDDGQTAWYVSNDALYQLNTATGETRQRIAPTGQAYVEDTVCPGSAVQVSGAGLGGNTFVLFDGMRPPIVSRGKSSMWFQIPWEARPSNSVPVSVEGESPFEVLRTVVNVVPLKPRFATPAIHQDWSGFVTTASPARPGEILHFYAVGLGPVQPSVATGVPGPENPLAMLATPLDCNVPVLFAGLAPGLVGFYQVTVQIPADAAPPGMAVSCSGTGSSVMLGP